MGRSNAYGIAGEGDNHPWRRCGCRAAGDRDEDDQVQQASDSSFETGGRSSGVRLGATGTQVFASLPLPNAKLCFRADGHARTGLPLPRQPALSIQPDHEELEHW